jgi:hypothetical protein
MVTSNHWRDSIRTYIPPEKIKIAPGRGSDPEKIRLEHTTPPSSKARHNSKIHAAEKSLKPEKKADRVSLYWHGSKRKEFSGTCPDFPIRVQINNMGTHWVCFVQIGQAMFKAHGKSRESALWTTRDLNATRMYRQEIGIPEKLDWGDLSDKSHRKPPTAPTAPPKATQKKFNRSAEKMSEHIILVCHVDWLKSTPSAVKVTRIDETPEERTARLKALSDDFDRRHGIVKPETK